MRRHVLASGAVQIALICLPQMRYHCAKGGSASDSTSRQFPLPPRWGERSSPARSSAPRGAQIGRSPPRYQVLQGNHLPQAPLASWPPGLVAVLASGLKKAAEEIHQGAGGLSPPSWPGWFSLRNQVRKHLVAFRRVSPAASLLSKHSRHIPGARGRRGSRPTRCPPARRWRVRRREARRPHRTALRYFAAVPV